MLESYQGEKSKHSKALPPLSQPLFTPLLEPVCFVVPSLSHQGKLVFHEQDGMQQSQ